MYEYLADKQHPLRIPSYETKDGFSDHSFTKQLVYLHPRPSAFSCFCQHVTICALPPQILMLTVIMLILKYLHRRELQLTWSYDYYMAHARKWHVTY
jgi:hypothetical protein